MKKLICIILLLVSIQAQASPSVECAAAIEELVAAVKKSAAVNYKHKDLSADASEEEITQAMIEMGEAAQQEWKARNDVDSSCQ